MHGGGCTCGDCPHGVHAGHRRAVAEFVARRDELASGEGLPVKVAYSEGASRQWISDELTESARAVAERSRAAGHSWLVRIWRRTLMGLWGVAALLFVVQAATAVGAGWTANRTAGLAGAVCLAALLTVAAWLHRSHGGLLAPLVGEDNRLSTSRSVAAAWLLFAAYAVLFLAFRLAVAAPGPGPGRGADSSGFGLGRGAALLTVVAVVCLVAVVVGRVVTVRVVTQRLQKVQADRPHLADVLCDDSGRGSFPDTQYVLVSATALTYAAVLLARRPEGLPQLPWGLTVLVLVSAAVYLAGKYAEGGRPVVLSVVRAREPGDLDGPIRTGDDIEIRGAGFVPPGAGAPDRLARMTVRIGPVHVHVPLVPVPGGFTNPTDTSVTVPVPADVEPGRVEVQVVTASGAESNRVAIDVTD
ncbi:hypothetical protein J4032_04200 [Streptomyces formicae]|uniref:Integral membrane protein n=1 Tax=Streptomyces formicae TaxID=1616117 RepID=A0ABY3WYF6_9ACTN|nr:hypothetical protein [Streptomyces formicae]UNM16327.1 hypothetical protein J4032_04200 [Streptomyces formicae]